uniref:alpha-protein kinase 1 n=1 Tax=Myxine glutinosa TaxID=7769 RepID=UPI00358FA6EA
MALGGPQIDGVLSQCHALLKNRVSDDPESASAIPCLIEALPVLLRSLLEEAKDMVWAFVPEQWQYVHAESPEEKVDSMDIIRTHTRSLLELLECALRGGDPYTAAAVCFLLDRPMYWSGNSRSLLHLVRALRHHAPTAPQLVIRQARLYVNAGQLQKAEFILNSLIENKGETGTWNYREDKDRTLVQAVCVQIRGQILHKLGLWLESAEFLLLSIIGFQSLPIPDKKGISSSLGYLAEIIFSMSDENFSSMLSGSPYIPAFIKTCGHRLLAGAAAARIAALHVEYAAPLVLLSMNRCGSCLLSYSQLPDCPSSERETCVRQAADAFEVSLLTSLRGVGEAPSRQQLHAFILAAFGQAVAYREMGREEVEGDISAADMLTEGPGKDSDGVVEGQLNNIHNNLVEDRKACWGLDFCADLLKRLRLASSDTGSVMEEAAAVVWQSVQGLAKTIDERRHRRSDAASCMPDRYRDANVKKVLLSTDNFGAIMRERGAKFRVLKSKELSKVGHSIFTVVATTEHYSGGPQPKDSDCRSTPAAENESCSGVQILKGESDHQAPAMDSDPFLLAECDESTKFSRTVLVNNLTLGLKELDLNSTSKIVRDDGEQRQNNAVSCVGAKESNTQLVDANAGTAPSEEWYVLEEKERVVQPSPEIVNASEATEEEIDDSLRGSHSSSCSSWVKVSSLHLSSASSSSKPISQRTTGSQGSGSFEMIGAEISLQPTDLSKSSNSCAVLPGAVTLQKENGNDDPDNVLKENTALARRKAFAERKMVTVEVDAHGIVCPENKTEDFDEVIFPNVDSKDSKYPKDRSSNIFVENAKTSGQSVAPPVPYLNLCTELRSMNSEDEDSPRHPGGLLSLTVMKTKALKNLLYTRPPMPAMKENHTYQAVVLKYSIQSETWLGQETLLHVGERLPLPKRLLGNQRETFWIHYLHQDEPQGRYVGKCYRKVKMGHYYVDNVLRQSKAQYYVTEFNKRLLQQDILTQIFYLPATLLLILDHAGQVAAYMNAEPYIEGLFVKLSNNTTVCKNDLPATRYGMAFSHFTYNMSLAQELIVDLQGWVTADGGGLMYLTDPLLHTALKLDNSMDHGLRGFENFWKHQHPVCSDICAKLGLQRGNEDTT